MANANWVNSYFGTLASDFTLRGSWSDVLPGPGGGIGVLDWRLDFAEIGGLEGTTLQVTEMVGGFGDDFLVEPEASANLTVRLRDGNECLSVVAEGGAVYELFAPPGWTVATPLSLYGPDGEVIRPADPFEVTGELARGTGFCGPGLIVFADRMGTSPTP